MNFGFDLLDFAVVAACLIAGSLLLMPIAPEARSALVSALAFAAAFVLGRLSAYQKIARAVKELEGSR